MFICQIFMVIDKKKECPRMNRCCSRADISNGIKKEFVGAYSSKAAISVWYMAGLLGRGGLLSKILPSLPMM